MRKLLLLLGGSGGVAIFIISVLAIFTTLKEDWFKNFYSRFISNYFELFSHYAVFIFVGALLLVGVWYLFFNGSKQLDDFFARK